MKMLIVNLGKTVKCRYGDGNDTTTGVVKKGHRPTPECAVHVQRSIERHQRGK